ncbi:hypothetical protein MXB_2999 [Myxobolus squamalis]|nr:hypothetical protein MXB_2999 [Myxobolus squamalis]
MTNSNKKFNPISASIIEDVVPLRAVIISAQFVIDKSTEIIACVETFGLPKDQYSFKVKAKKVLDENTIFEKNEIILEKVVDFY